MRLYLKLTRSKEIIPFNYQSYLTGTIHKWLGKENNLHDNISMYSFSWLQNVNINEQKGISLRNDSYFFISAYDETIIKQLVKGIMNNPSAFWGANISDIEIKENPAFSNNETFLVASPVFIKRRFEEIEKHITYEDPRSSLFLTETLKKKLSAAGLSQEEVTVSFDKSYHSPQTKIIRYKQIANRVNLCPVIVNGTPEQISFAWNVGIGNSTGIGFGALK